MEYKDYYKILGVPRTATQPEIKKAYRKLARAHHPDVKPGDKAAEQRFKDVNEAHAVLGDPDKRKKYDALGANWEAFERAGAAGGSPDPFGPGGPFAGFRTAGGAGAAGGAGGAGPNVRYEFRTNAGGADLGGFSDFFRMVFGGGGNAGRASSTSGRARGRAGTATDDAYEDLFSQLNMDPSATGTAGPTTRSAAVEATAELSLEEAFHGTTRIVEVDGKRLEVTIPRGVDTGRRIRLTGRGGNGRDLVVVVRVRAHPVFTRKGDDLERELPITLRDALLGAAVTVETLKGRGQLTIPPGTQNGRVFRLSGQGMPRFKADSSGDLYVKMRVVLPTTLSDEATDAAARFLDLVDQPDPR